MIIYFMTIDYRERKGSVSLKILAGRWALVCRPVKTTFISMKCDSYPTLIKVLR